jgi:hypothetical protein
VSDGSSLTYLNSHFLWYHFTRYRRGGREQHVKPFDRRRVGQNRMRTILDRCTRLACDTHGKPAKIPCHPRKNIFSHVPTA